jgi:hypothetical protein
MARVAEFREAQAPMVGEFVKPDGWYVGGELEASEWEKAEFRLGTWRAGGVKMRLAVNVKVTGETVQVREGGFLAVRVAITFVGDGEPDVTVGGWKVAR